MEFSSVHIDILEKVLGIWITWAFLSLVYGQIMEQKDLIKSGAGVSLRYSKFVGYFSLVCIIVGLLSFVGYFYITDSTRVGFLWVATFFLVIGIYCLLEFFKRKYTLTQSHLIIRSPWWPVSRIAIHEIKTITRRKVGSRSGRIIYDVTISGGKVISFSAYLSGLSTFINKLKDYSGATLN